jgi:Transposase DDE domain group 1
VVIATRLRKGWAGSGKGAHALVAEAIRVLREAGVTATVLVRADSAFFSAKPVTAIRAAGACYSITVADTKTIRAAIATVPETAWTPIKYRNAVRDADGGPWISEAEIAEIPCTAFTSKKAEPHTRGRLIVRRVWRLNPATVPDGQRELFAAHRHHAFHTTNPPVIDQTEPMRRQHAVI